MKGFFTGLISCLIYAAICVVVLAYSFDTIFPNSNKQDSLLNDTSTNYLKVESEDILSGVLEDSLQNEPLIDEKMDVASQELLEQVEEPQDGLTIPKDEGIIKPVNQIDVIKENTNSDIFFNVILSDGTQLLECDSYTTVFKNQNQVKIPYECRNYGVILKSYLDREPSATLKITGFSDVQEDPLNGKERASYLKKLLTNTGIPNDRILVANAIDYLNFKGGTAQGGIIMKIEKSSTKTTPNKKTSIASSTNSGKKAAITSKVFTSGFQGDYYYGDQTFTSYITTIKQLLKQNPTAKVYGYSYINGTGNKENDFAISRDNASTVRKILVQNGIPSEKIESVARGGKTPNSTTQNKSIIISVK